MAKRERPKAQEGSTVKYTVAKQEHLSSGPNWESDQFRLMVDAVVDYAIYMLDSDGRIMTWNPGAQRVKGYSHSEVIGRHYSMFFTEDTIRAGKPQRELERAKLEGRFEEEGWRVRKIGPQFWANVVLTLSIIKGCCAAS